MLHDVTATGTGTESCVVGSTYTKAETIRFDHFAVKPRNNTIQKLRYCGETARRSILLSQLLPMQLWSVGVAGHSGDVNETEPKMTTSIVRCHVN